MAVTPGTANDELKRGIDEQLSRHNGRLVITGLLSGTGIAATAQMLSTDTEHELWRWIVAAITLVSFLLVIVVWIEFQCLDVDPRARLQQAASAGWSDDELLIETAVRRMLAYELNEESLSSTFRTMVYRGALTFGAASVVAPVVVLVTDAN
jgi:hypothetical protein